MGKKKYYIKFLEKEVDYVRGLLAEEQLRAGGYSRIAAQSLEQLESVLCNPDGGVCIDGSGADLQTITDALEKLRDIAAR